METTDHIVLKAISLYFRPILYLVRRNILYINCLVKACIGIRSCCSDSSHQFIIFIRDSQLRRFVWYTVDLMIDGFPFCFVGSLTIDFKQTFNLIQHRFFLFIILRSEMSRSLEHQMFKVMRQTRCFCRIILSPHSYRDISLNSRSFFVYGQIHFQPVTQGINTGFHRIIGNRFVRNSSTLRTCRQHT